MAPRHIDRAVYYADNTPAQRRYGARGLHRFKPRLCVDGVNGQDRKGPQHNGVPLVRPMRLTLAYHPVTDIRFGATTQLQGTTLEVSEAALRQHLLEDRRLERVDLAIVHPGEACRFGVVFDIVEPRAKEPGAGPDFPGILDPIARVGQGITHVLQGAAVTVLDAAAPIAGGQVVEMSGDAGKACPYAGLSHLVVVPHVVPGLERPRALHALRLASVKAAVYLGRTSVRHTPANSADFASLGPVEASRPGLPRLAYIGQIHSRQRVAEADEPILYGANTAGM